jgi:hypothetical protein
MEESYVPGLHRIEEVNARMEKEGMFFRDYDADFENKQLGQYAMFHNIDLEDCVRPLSEAHIDQSIRNLRRDRNKDLVEQHARQYWQKCCERFLYGSEEECINRQPRPSHTGLGLSTLISLCPYEDWAIKQRMQA